LRPFLFYPSSAIPSSIKPLSGPKNALKIDSLPLPDSRLPPAPYAKLNPSLFGNKCKFSPLTFESCKKIGNHVSKLTRAYLYV
jgi:hypothetical protein